jgi:DNA repair and recombination RAD54-like protein
MWTLLKQSTEAGKTIVQKCVIACPSTLVRNWANELGMGKESAILQASTDFNSEMARS